MILAIVVYLVALFVDVSVQIHVFKFRHVNQKLKELVLASVGSYVKCHFDIVHHIMMSNLIVNYYPGQ